MATTYWENAYDADYRKKHENALIDDLKEAFQDKLREGALAVARPRSASRHSRVRDVHRDVDYVRSVVPADDYDHPDRKHYHYEHYSTSPDHKRRHHNHHGRSHSRHRHYHDEPRITTQEDIVIYREEDPFHHHHHHDDHHHHYDDHHHHHHNDHHHAHHYDPVVRTETYVVRDDDDAFDSAFSEAEADEAMMTTTVTRKKKRNHHHHHYHNSRSRSRGGELMVTEREVGPLRSRSHSHVRACSNSRGREMERITTTTTAAARDPSHSTFRDLFPDEKQWRQIALAAIETGLVSAYRQRNMAGDWKGAKGKRVATAAVSAAGIEKLLIRDGRGDENAKRHMIEAVLGGLVTDRLVNGSRKDQQLKELTKECHEAHRR